jgi:hypothetical protein
VAKAAGVRCEKSGPFGQEALAALKFLKFIPQINLRGAFDGARRTSQGSRSLSLSVGRIKVASGAREGLRLGHGSPSRLAAVWAVRTLTERGWGRGGAESFKRPTSSLIIGIGFATGAAKTRAHRSIRAYNAISAFIARRHRRGSLILPQVRPGRRDGRCPKPRVRLFRGRSAPLSHTLDRGASAD